jgi:anti-anti-sigma regulatory factor
MLRITIRSHAGRTTIALEGRLAGPSVEHLRACWLEEIETRKPDSIRINLADVAFVDAAGKSLLRSFHERGADLTAAGLMTRAILEEITGNRGLDDTSSDSHDDS